MQNKKITCKLNNIKQIKIEKARKIKNKNTGRKISNGWCFCEI